MQLITLSNGLQTWHYTEADEEKWFNKNSFQICSEIRILKGFILKATAFGLEVQQQNVKKERKMCSVDTCCCRKVHQWSQRERDMETNLNIIITTSYRCLFHKPLEKASCHITFPAAVQWFHSLLSFRPLPFPLSLSGMW